jgi:hypothetical protein
MKLARISAALLLVLTTTAAFAQTDAQKSFDKVKSLEGKWEAKGPDGHPMQVSFRVTAAGSAIMSEIAVHGEDMITMFHLDGANRLLMTHYCSVGNQPHMVASVSPDGKTITFDYLDANNLDPSQPGHMKRMVLTMVDATHHNEVWDFEGKTGPLTETFELARKN